MVVNIQESKKLIVEYVRENDEKLTENELIKYIETEALPEEFRLSRVIALRTIHELEGSNRIKLLKPKGWRSGQSYRVAINDQSWFQEITENLSGLRKDILRLNSNPTWRSNRKLNRQNERLMQQILDELLINLRSVRMYIKDQDDRQTLNDKILDYMLGARFGFILPKS